MTQLSITQTAQLIGVSAATVRNWAKAGYITPIKTRPITFPTESVMTLKNQIGSAFFGKLKIRANKAGSTQHFLPEEYSENTLLKRHILDLVAYVQCHQLELETVMFWAALRLLATTGEICYDPKVNIDRAIQWKRASVKAVMVAWHTALAPPTDETPYRQLYEFMIPTLSDDFLGLLYQSLSDEGNKSKRGSYYTPSKLVADALAQFEGPIETFLDPCCGSGKYLLLAAKQFKLNPESIWGFDCDSVATRIASINLLIAYPDTEFVPHIFCLDTLSELTTGYIPPEIHALLGKIDAIATNPPWGAYKNAASKALFLGQVKSGESFAMFLEKSLQFLSPGGQLSFLLPESILKIKLHADIRELILNETKISRVVMLGRRFTGVFTPVIRLDLVKQVAPDDWLLSVEQEGQWGNIAQARFKRNDNFTFDLTTELHDKDVLERIYAVEHVTLANHGTWALGIVTGNNKKYVMDTPLPGSEAVFRGSDVLPYYLGEPTSFLHFTPNTFQQTAPERLFRSPEKLVYRFISRKLVFAYDNQQRLTLNSANILIPALPGLSIKVVLAFLNSTVFQYIFSKKFATHKVLRGDLEKLPFPVIDMTTHQTIEQMVDEAIFSQQAPPELDEVILKIFRLNHADLYQSSTH